MRNWTEARALRATNVRLRKIDNLLLEIAGLWGDVDQGIVNVMDDLRRQVEEASTHVRESVDERRERLAAEAA